MAKHRIAAIAFILGTAGGCNLYFTDPPSPHGHPDPDVDGGTFYPDAAIFDFDGGFDGGSFDGGSGWPYPDAEVYPDAGCGYYGCVDAGQPHVDGCSTP